MKIQSFLVAALVLLSSIQTIAQTRIRVNGYSNNRSFTNVNSVTRTNSFTNPPFTMTPVTNVTNFNRVNTQNFQWNRPGSFNSFTNQVNTIQYQSNPGNVFIP